MKPICQLAGNIDYPTDNPNSPTRHGKSYFVENFESDTEDPVYVVSHSTKKDKISGPAYKIVGEIKIRVMRKSHL